MPSSPDGPVDLLDLKLLPAWVKETGDGKQYEHYEGEDGGGPRHEGRRENRRQFRQAKAPRPFDRKRDEGRARRPQDRPRKGRGRENRPPRGRGRPDRQATPPPKPLEVEIQFAPQRVALENVTAQIQSSAVAYSLFALARLFLEKPERYEVRVKTKLESALYQLGENGALSSNREFLERGAFRLAEKDFYTIDVTESEPIKGNFTNVARCKLSGTLLGPTNHHSYQARLRNLFEQRFSRRMSFADYQRSIEIVSDPAAVEQWKEDARKVTTFTTLREDPPSTFANASEAEKHFRQKYLPALVRQVTETTMDGVASRRLPDRGLHRAIEDAWTRETRSPSQMMQELAARFRERSLQIFRHRKGMLFVSSIRVRPFARQGVAMSSNVSAILETLSTTPRINRKDLADKVLVDLAGEEAEARKLALASDLHWLISEGYVIEFNDGSLDLPREKKPKPEAKTVEAASGAVEAEPVNAAAPEKVDAAETGPAG